MAPHHPVDRHGRRLVEGRGAQADAVGAGGQLRVRSERDAHHPGVEQPQQLLGAQGWRARLQAVDAAPDVGLEVDVGVEGETTELDDRTQLVPEDAQHLLGRLDRAPPGSQGLGEVVLDHVVDLALVVGGRRVVAV